MDANTYDKFFSGFLITDCLVRSKDIIYFIAEQDIEAEGLDYYENIPTTRIIIYYRTKQPATWGSKTFDDVKRLRAGVCFQPVERFVGVSFWGQIFVIGGGQSGFEEEIGIDENYSINNVKCINGGKVYAAGTRRHIFRRDDVNKWVQIGDMPNEKKAGFLDIDGFSDHDLYAAGSNGDVWHYNGQQWKKIEVPTTGTIEYVCCAEDGVVYMAGWHGRFLKGRGDQWETIFPPDPVNFYGMVWFKDRLYLSAPGKLYQYKDNALSLVTFDKGDRPLYIKYLSANKDLLLSANNYGATLFDGEEWTHIVGDYDEDLTVQYREQLMNEYSQLKDAIIQDQDEADKIRHILENGGPPKMPEE